MSFFLQGRCNVKDCKFSHHKPTIITKKNLTMYQDTSKSIYKYIIKIKIQEVNHPYNEDEPFLDTTYREIIGWMTKGDMRCILGKDAISDYNGNVDVYLISELDTVKRYTWSERCNKCECYTNRCYLEESSSIEKFIVYKPKIFNVD